ncbi:MAG: monofunctional biosynthetic peptidoglycan transglycosylase [Betaproteobacteria bacterium]|nr:monofunctional biosynthetic peptidoglycan transglycosylase [Betaproteobacteria bacterium]
MRVFWNIFFGTLGLFVAAVLLVQGWFFAQVWWWVGHDPSTTAFMRTRIGELRDKDPKANIRQTWIGYGRISVHLKRAVVAAEDAKFVDHEGFDWEGIQKALEKNEKKGKVVAGGSTISQQLAKNLFLSGSRSWLRKGQEAAITWMLESAMDKRRILEIYLNVAEWGVGVFGAEAAARHYFGVSAAALSAEQSAWLAAILPAPQRYDRNRGVPWIAKKAEILFSRMPGAQIP